MSTLLQLYKQSLQKKTLIRTTNTRFCSNVTLREFVQNQKSSLVTEGDEITACASEQMLLVHPKIRWGRESRPKNTTTELQVDEARALCQTIPGFRVVSSIMVGTDYNTKKKMVWKAGRLEAIREFKQTRNVSAIMINVDILSPLQQRELTYFFGVPIYDRYNIVLGIFKLFAKTKEAKLQIALAEIPYIRERLKFLESNKDTSSQSLHIAESLVSLKDMACEKRYEILRRREHTIRKQIQVEMDLANQKLVEKKEKGRNVAARIPLVAVIGYTNAGKTTLIKRLTNSSSLLGENRLFATLDTTTHLGILPSANRVLYADTVGFISNLPFKFFASFAATLQHVQNADLLIHIIDLSHPDMLAQRDNVLSTLEKLKMPESLMEGMITVGNKLDRCDDARKTQLEQCGLLLDADGTNAQCHTFIPFSCRTLEGMVSLVHRLDEAVQLMNGSKNRRIKLTHSSEAIPYLYEKGFVIVDPTPSECNNFLLFDVVMSDEQFAKFQSVLGIRFKRRREGETEEVD